MTLAAPQIDVRRRAKSVVRSALALLSRTPAGAKFYETLYETSPQRIADMIAGLGTQPDFDLTWATRLLNGRKVHIPVHAGNPRSWEFALAYRWHDLDIRELEYALYRRFAAKNIEPIFLDIGANMGLRALLPLSMGLQCFLFEPNPELQDFTKSLFALNGFRNFEIHNLGLSDRCGSADFHISANSYMSSLDREWIGAEEPVRKIDVRVTTLDQWMDERAELRQMPAVVKIDVEGAELRVLEGARHYIAARRPAIICEISLDTGNRAQIFDYCASQRYRIHWIRPGATRLVEPLDAPTFIGDSQHVNFLLAPEESATLNFEN
jgi:FkbM family methyltransferase